MIWDIVDAVEEIARTIAEFLGLKSAEAPDAE